MLNKSMRKYVLYFCLLMNIGFMTGCNRNTGDDIQSVSDSPDVTEENAGLADDAEETEAPSTDNVSKDSEKDSIKDELSIANDVKELSIYCITDDASDKESVVSMIPKDTKVTAQVIVDCVVSEFADNSLEIGIDSVEVQDGSVIVSFQSKKAPVANVGAGVEGIILDCMSQSLLDNLDSCQKVIFRIEGKAYESGHFLFGIDEAYDWK